MKNKFRVGDSVKSRFRSHWSGVVLKVGESRHCPITNKPTTPPLTVLVVLDYKGNRVKNRTVHTYDSGWFEKTGQIDLDMINPDWLEI